MNLNKLGLGLSIARLFQMLLVFLSIKILTFYLDEKQIGFYYTIGAVISFFNLVFFNAPSMYLSRDLHRYYEEKKLKSAFLYFGLWVVFISILSVLCIFTLDYYKVLRLNNFLFYFFFALIISTFYRNIINGFNVLIKHKLFITFSSLNLVLGLIFSIILTYYSKTAIFWLSGGLFVEFMILIASFKFFFDKKESIISFRSLDIKKITMYCYPIAISASFLWIQTQSYKIIIENRYSAEALSSLALGLSISSGIYVGVQSILEQMYLPKFYIKLKGSKCDREEAWSELQKITLPLYLLTLFFILTFAKHIENFFLSKTFQYVVIYIQLGALINFIRIFISNLQLITVSEKITNKMIIPSFISCVVLLILLLFLNFDAHFYLIPVSIIFSFLLSLIYLYYSLKKSFKIKIAFMDSIKHSIPIILFFLFDSVLSINSVYFFILFLFYYSYIFINYLNQNP